MSTEQQKQLTIQKMITLGVYLFTMSVYGSMAMMSIGAAIAMTFGICGMILLTPKYKFEWRTQFVYSTIALSVLCIASLFWADVTHLEFHGVRSDVHWVLDSRKLWHLYLPLVLYVVLEMWSLEEIMKLTKVWFYAALSIALFTFIQYHFPIYKPQALPHLDYQNYVRGTGIVALLKGSYHATGLTGFHLSYASIIGFPAAFSFVYFGLSFQKWRWSKRTFQSFVVALIFIGSSILTYSKMTWLSIPLVFLGVVLMLIKGKFRWLLTLAVIVIAAFGTQTEEFRLRFQGTDTIQERFEVWNANLEMIKEHPFLGVGWHHNSPLTEGYYREHGIQNGFVSHAHNNFLDQAASTGLLGLAAFLWWNTIVVLMAYRIYRSTDDIWLKSLGAGFLAGWMCLHLNGLTQTNWWDAKVLHQMGWVTALTLVLYKKIVREKKITALIAE